jgi:diacylglycerol kinase family enzyme
VLEERCGVSVVRVRVDRHSAEETIGIVCEAVRERVRSIRAASGDLELPLDAIHVIATTMSGSIQDQRKVRRIGPEFRKRTDRPVAVHPADTHEEAQAIAHDLVARGYRTIVSAGGAGTFNAVVEGCLMEGGIPPDLRLANLRKGSADLIGKVLGIPDSLPEASDAIVGGLESDRVVRADVLTVQARDPNGRAQVRHIVGFGGLGIFGDVPRFTETRAKKLYKGVLGSLFGDLGPFYVGLGLAAVRWQLLRVFGRVSRTVLELDGQEQPADCWATVAILNGDLGKGFPLGRDLDLGSGSFRVVALRHRGLRLMLRQINACRTAAVLDHPDEYAALVRDVTRLVASPLGVARPYMFNVDGLRMMVLGPVTVSVAGNVRLVAGQRIAIRAPAAV